MSGAPAAGTAEGDGTAEDDGTAEGGEAGTAARTGADARRLHAALAAALADQLDAAVSFRHELHAAADVSGSEEPTAERVAAALGDPGAPWVAGAGRLVRIGPAAGPSLAIRAEIGRASCRERVLRLV